MRLARSARRSGTILIARDGKPLVRQGYGMANLEHDVPNRPDGILFEPLTQRVYIFSHADPSVVVIDPKDGSVVGTIDIGGAMEQAQSDGQGHVYADIENQKKIAVIDANTMKVTAKYDLGDSAGEPGGLGLDAKNHILFAMCADPSV